jgi:PEP-CTERM motif-containing protein
MNRALKALGLAAILLLFPAFADKAAAIPMLQLDMAGGVYDPVTETIVAPGGGPFTVYAILTPKNNATAAQIQALLNTKYFVSVALSPQTAPPGGSLGSFTFGPSGGTQSTVNVTGGMTYGVPPIEIMSSLQGHDPGDLSQHGVYPTYFSEFGFYFSAANKTVAYNTQTNPGGPTPSAAGTSYYAAFTGNNALLLAAYQLHFDLYNEAVQNCATKKNPGPCLDVDIDSFAPFSHDASTIPPPPPPVPEPATIAMMLMGLAVGGRQLRQRIK